MLNQSQAYWVGTCYKTEGVYTWCGSHFEWHDVGSKFGIRPVMSVMKNLLN